jgi:diaminopimelate decarboxylase
VRPVDSGNGGGELYEIVGPVCESADFLAHARKLALREGDLLAIMSAGAYGMSMSSNYNTRAVMVDNEDAHLIRAREAISDLMSTERLLP